jgi:hypothetical protein
MWFNRFLKYTFGNMVNHIQYIFLLPYFCSVWITKHRVSNLFLLTVSSQLCPLFFMSPGWTILGHPMVCFLQILIVIPLLNIKLWYRLLYSGAVIWRSLALPVYDISQSWVEEYSTAVRCLFELQTPKSAVEGLQWSKYTPTYVWQQEESLV